MALGQRPHVEIFGTDYPTPDGTCIRDYIHVDDLAEAHLLALEKLAAGAGLAVQRRHRHGLQRPRGDPDGGGGDAASGSPVKEGPRRAGDPPALVAASDKVRRELGW